MQACISAVATDVLVLGHPPHADAAAADAGAQGGAVERGRHRHCRLGDPCLRSLGQRAGAGHGLGALRAFSGKWRRRGSPCVACARVCMAMDTNLTEHPLNHLRYSHSTPRCTAVPDTRIVTMFLHRAPHAEREARQFWQPRHPIRSWPPPCLDCVVDTFDESTKIRLPHSFRCALYLDSCFYTEGSPQELRASMSLDRLLRQRNDLECWKARLYRRRCAHERSHRRCVNVIRRSLRRGARAWVEVALQGNTEARIASLSMTRSSWSS